MSEDRYHVPQSPSHLAQYSLVTGRKRNVSVDKT